MEEIKQLVNKLNRWNCEYYTLDNPSVSDKEYDKEYDRLLKLEKETGIILPNTPTVKIGGEILKGFEKVEHKKKLWSLDKAQSFDELKEWIKRCENFVADYNRTHSTQLPQLQYVVTKKFDGITLKCDYEDIDFKQGSTRGSGTIGEVVTEQSKAIINLPLQLNDNDRKTELLSPHGECLMSKKALIEYNKTAKEPLKNCRNGVAGAIRNLDPKETAKRKPIIYFYNINDIKSNMLYHETYQQQLEYMRYRGLPIAEYTICNTYEEIVKVTNNIEKERPNLNYDIDGAVISINDLATRQAMGYTEKFPRYSLAYKYEAEETTTKLLDVSWNVSRYGRLNPKAKIKPVELMGVTLKQATLNNIDDIERKKIKINSEVFIRRSNDVIPEITGVVDESLNNKDIRDIVYPTICPCCESPIEIRQPKETRFLFCTNDNCPDRLIQALSHYVSKEAMNIVGFSEQTIKQFIENGFIKSIKDIYNLEQFKDRIIKLPKFGIKKYNNLIKSIEESRSCKLNSFLYALGIENVGKKASKDICKYFKNDLDMIMVVGTHEYLKIEGIGDTIADSIVSYFSSTKTIRRINEVISYLIFIEDKPKEVIDIKENPLLNKHIYPTGKFSLTKSELKIQLEKAGAIIETGYKKSLDYLIVANDSSKSGKADKAKIDRVPIMSEDKMTEILNNL